MYSYCRHIFLPKFYQKWGVRIIQVLGNKISTHFLSPKMEFTDQVSTITSTTNHVPNNAQFMLAHRYSCHFALRTLTYKYIGE